MSGYICRPTIGPDGAMRQAGDTVALYLGRAIGMIDAEFGAGYAKAHPELVAECVRSQTLDMTSTVTMCFAFDAVDAIKSVADALEHRL